MNRLRLWGLSAAVAAGLGGSATAADPYMTSDQTTLVQKLFGPKPPKPAAAATPATITAPLSPDALAKAVQAEQDALLRRISICDNLRRIADDRGDNTLYRTADDLERQAATIYNARVTALGVPKLKTPLPEPTTTAVRVPPPAEPRVAADRLLAPAAPIPSTSTAEVHEVKP